ncbi:MAG: hypothetical protein AAF802_16870 [Planctomycetota bacterium]
MNRHSKVLKFLLVLLAGLCLTAASASAHHPDRQNQPVTPVIDVIGPIGNRLPPGHRRKYNRPSYLMGYLSYKIAPSSQEAMSWHRAVHSGAYRDPKKDCRLEHHYFYPKPWQVLTVGPRQSRLQPPPPASPVVELEADLLQSGRAIEELMEEPETLEMPDVQIDVPELPSPSDQ